MVIGDEAFAGCTKLSNIKLPKDLYILGEGAFEGCTGLESVTVEKNVYVKANAFAGWTADQTVNFVGDQYSVFILGGSDVVGNSNANFVFNYKETAGE